MKRSAERILTTHAGSLPRPTDLLDMARSHGASAAEPGAYAARVKSAVTEAVRRQAQHGLDVVTDGEMSKPSFVTYITERLTGFERSPDPGGLPWAGSKEVTAFPQFYEPSLRQSPNAAAPRFVCTGPVSYMGHRQVQADIDNLKAALTGLRVEEAFLPAIAPSNVEGRQPNRHYRTDEEYLFAIADAMREEYRIIVDAGLLLQIDDPRLVTYYILDPRSTVAECRRWAEVRVEALNHALRGIPRDRVRFHTCYSINMGPRVHDMELKDVVDIILKVKAGAYSFEAANPRHEHEWRVWKDVTLPEGALLIPGVITQSTVLVEHPELVAERIARFASVVGRENVVAGADCGFASFAGSTEIPAEVVWAKLGALVEGARLASRELWGGR
ncbi:MAG TPA: cobalamin-independent methionine synthase II family protein [Candidatus Limnocylindrales bacterium]|nr:cobalamin-independent methionine synthase II family protein [Candidatus Limnocylindrales bacterium]